MIDQSRAVEPSSESRAEAFTADVLTKVVAGTAAIEAESIAMIDLERAYQRANDAAAELRSSIRAEVAARAETVRARDATKKPFREEEKAARTAAKADQVERNKTATVKAKQDQLAKDERAGKQRDPAAIDKVKLKADDAGRQARAAHLALEKAKEASEAARARVRSAQEEAKLAADQLRAARIDDAGAKRDVEAAEGNAKKTIEAASVALMTEMAAKKALDKAIMALKAIMLQEAKAAEAAAAERAIARQGDQAGPRGIVGQPVEKLKGLTSGVTKKAGQLSRLGRRAPRDLPEIAEVSKSQSARPDSPVETDHETYDGVVRLLIFDPVNHADVMELQRGLERIDGVRVTSVAGSSDRGTCITLAAAQPVPLASQLGQLAVVDKVLKRGKDLEVRLRLPESRPVGSSISVLR